MKENKIKFLERKKTKNHTFFFCFVKHFTDNILNSIKTILCRTYEETHIKFLNHFDMYQVQTIFRAF